MEWLFGAGYGLLGGALVGYAGYRKALKEGKTKFDPAKFALTLGVCAGAGVVYAVAIGEPDIVTTGAFSGFIEVVLNRLSLNTERLGL